MLSHGCRWSSARQAPSGDAGRPERCALQATGRRFETCCARLLVLLEWVFRLGVEQVMAFAGAGGANQGATRLLLVRVIRPHRASPGR